MKIIRTDSFKKDFKKLPKDIKTKAIENLRMLIQNPHYPSLKVKKMQGIRDVWEMRISLSFRLTFSLGKGACVLRRIGSHDILKSP